MNTIRVVVYLNQFFAGLGAEEYAGTGPGKKAGALGPGIALQQVLGERAQVTATVYCGDNYANERRTRSTRSWSSCPRSGRTS